MLDQSGKTFHIFRKKQRLYIFRIDDEALWIDAKDPILALVPHPIAVDPVPIPGAHISGGNSEAASLFALDQPRRRGLEIGGTGAHAPFKLGIETFELSRLAEQLGEHLDLGAKHLGYH